MIRLLSVWESLEYISREIGWVREKVMLSKFIIYGLSIMVVEHLPVAYQMFLVTGEAAKDNLTTYALNNSRNLTEPLCQTIASNVSYVASEVAKQSPQPGLEGIFAITGLMAVAYMVLGRKQ
jgi:hypothetical protein